MKLKPATVLFIYLGLILLYAVLYCYIPGVVVEKDWGLIKSIYFSTVTITTLGYGEITPKSDIGMLLTGSEAILGIVIIGLFLSSLWQSFVKSIEEKQEESIKKRIAEKNLHSLISFYHYLNTVISDYQIALAELTTPIGKRQGKLQPDPEFIFSDLQDLYKQSILTKSGFSKPVVHLYFEKLDVLMDELKYILSNFDLNEFPDIHKRIIDFLTLSRAQDIREALFSYEKMDGGGKMIKDNLEEMIKEHEKCPDLEKYQSNVITPAILLYQTLKFQIMQIKLLKEEFDSLVANNKIQPTSYVGG